MSLPLCPLLEIFPHFIHLVNSYLYFKTHWYAASSWKPFLTLLLLSVSASLCPLSSGCCACNTVGADDLQSVERMLSTRQTLKGRKGKKEDRFFFLTINNVSSPLKMEAWIPLWGHTSLIRCSWNILMMLYAKVRLWSSTAREGF